MKNIILASASPRRAELLKLTGLKFTVMPSNSLEIRGQNLEPRDLAQYLSLEKARLVASKHRDSLIIAADTFIVLNGQIIGKPDDKKEALQILNTLNGKKHLVITGLTVLDSKTDKVISKAVETSVYLKNLSVPDIKAYVDSGEPLDKAGAYAIQGLGAIIVDRIEGDFYNVIGLPLSMLADILKDFGVNVLRQL